MVQDLIERYYDCVPMAMQTLISAVEDSISKCPNAIVLDAGCGSEGTLVTTFSARATVYGADLDCETSGNLYHADLADLPFPNETFDIVYSRSVFEHLEKPALVMAELRRVLKPNGVLILITPNKWDYTSVVARFTPQWFHRWYVGSVCGVEYDMFPVRYRCNTPGWFKRLHGWESLEIRGLRHYPVNLKFSRLLFRVGVLYDYALAQLKLHALQPTLFVMLRKNH